MIIRDSRESSDGSYHHLNSRCKFYILTCTEIVDKEFGQNDLNGKTAQTWGLR